MDSNYLHSIHEHAKQCVNELQKYANHLTKTLCITVAALVFSEAACANGFYSGLGIGGTSLTVRETTTSPSDSHDLGSFGFMGGLFAGYEFIFHSQFHLGIEAFGNDSTAQANIVHNDNASRYQISSRYNYGVRFLPGYSFTPYTVSYLIIGYARGNFKAEDTGAFGMLSNTFNSNGLQLGIGDAIHVRKNLSLRGMITYTNYSTHYANGTTSSGATTTYSNRPATFDGMISLVYQFC